MPVGTPGSGTSSVDVKVPPQYVVVSGDSTDRTTRASAVDDTITTAANNSNGIVFVPEEFLNYDASAVTFDNSVRLVREGQVQDVYDVKAYGAAGDGSTDDTSSCDAVLVAANNANGEIRFPPGTYVIDRWLFDGITSVSVQGVPGGSVLLYAPNADEGVNDELVQLFNSCDDISFRGLVFDGNKSNQTNNTAELLRLNGATDVKVHNCQFINSDFYGIEINGTVDRLWVEDCIFDDNLKAAIHGQPNSGDITNVFIRNCHLTVPDGFAGVTDLEKLIHFQSGSNSIKHITIEGCHLNGNDSNRGASTEPIRDALWVTADHVTIVGNRIRDVRDDCITLQSCNDVTISGNSLSDSRNTGGVIFLDGSPSVQVAIVGNVFTDMNRGVGCNSESENVSIVGNVFKNMGIGSAADNASGVHVTQGSGATPPEGVVVEGNLFDHCEQQGVFVDQADRVVIVGNWIIDTGDGTGSDTNQGIRLSNTVRTVVANNVIWNAETDRTENGIVLIGSPNQPTDCRLEGNQIGPVRTSTISDAGVRTRINGLGAESANAETPTAANWDIGDIVDFTDSGDGSGDGQYLLARDGTTWLQIGT